MRPDFGIKLDVLTVKLNGAVVQCYSNGSPFFGKHFETKEEAIEFAQDFCKRNQAELFEYEDQCPDEADFACESRHNGYY